MERKGQQDICGSVYPLLAGTDSDTGFFPPDTGLNAIPLDKQQEAVLQYQQHKCNHMLLLQSTTLNLQNENLLMRMCFLCIMVFAPDSSAMQGAVPSTWRQKGEHLMTEMSGDIHVLITERNAAGQNTLFVAFCCYDIFL